MAHYVMSHSSYILRNHIAAMLDKRIGSGCLGKRNAGTRTAAEGNHVFQFAQSVTLRITGSEDDIGNILLNLLIEINLVYNLASLQNLLGRCYRSNLRKSALDILTDDELLLFQCRIIDDYLQQETVYLCFRQLIGSFLLDRVLCSHYQERTRQFEGFIANGNLVFLHGFEQRTLHLGWGTVNLICQDEIGEDRTALYMESLIFL